MPMMQSLMRSLVVVALTASFVVSASPASAAVTPDTSISGGPTGSVANKVATFTFTSTVSRSTFQCKFDAGVWAACASPKTYNKLKQGAHTFRVRAKKATRVDKTPAVRAFTVDTVAPNTTITAGPSGTILDLAPEFWFSWNERESTFECSIDGPPWSGQWIACFSPFRAASLYYREPYNFSVRATDAAGNVDASPATRPFLREPINLGGQPFAEAAARLYFPTLVDLDVPAQCGSGGVDCPGGTPLPASAQVRLQSTNLGVVYAVGTSRFDVTATLDVRTLPNNGISVQVPLVGDCTLALDASQGSLPTWTVSVSLQFNYDQISGDLNVQAADASVAGVESLDWQLSGDLGCHLFGGLNSGIVGNLFVETLNAYWSSLPVPLCEKPAPALVGSCPSWGP